MNRQPIDPTIPSDVYSSPELGTVVSVQSLDNSGVIMGAPNTIYVVNHYAPPQLVHYENWGDHLRIYINSYILGTINNVGLCVLSAQGTKEHQFAPDVVVRALGQKFLAERLLLHSESEIGRVLFLESIMVADPPLRRVLTAKESDDGLLAASNAFNHICADFITFHELGHAGKVDDRYAPFAQQTVASLDELPDFDFWKGDDRNRITEEVFSDIFAINTLFARHAPTWTAHSLVNYTGVVISALTNLLMLDLLKDDLIKANVDADHNTSHIEAGILELSHRHMALQGYLSDFEFGTETIVPVQEDNLPLIPQSNDLMTSLSDANSMLKPFDEHSRRVASLVSLGFQSGFDAIVDACKTGYEFERWF